MGGKFDGDEDEKSMAAGWAAKSNSSGAPWGGKVNKVCDKTQCGDDKGLISAYVLGCQT